MYQQKRRPRFSIAALALFLLLAQPFTALAAEPREEDPGQAGAVWSSLSSSPPVLSMKLWDDRSALQGETTRAQYIQILYEAVGAPAVSVEPLFTDVDITANYAAAVTWANHFGIVDNLATDYFRPEDLITQLEAEVWLTETLSALGSAAQQMANSLLAAYTGRVGEEEFALTPAAIVAALDEILSDSRLTQEYPAIVSSGPPPVSPPFLEEPFADL